MPAVSRRPRLFVAIAVWFAAIAAGVISLEYYKQVPGIAGTAPDGWSAQQQPHLLMFVHPHCPCTRASLNELAKILSLCPNEFDAEIVLVKPEGVSVGWEQGLVSIAATQLPRVRVSCDEDGTLAKSFGARTSGQVALFGVDGKLLFYGGITRSRGHSGENAGTQAVLAGLNGQTVLTTTTPVFGCSLLTKPEQHASAPCCITRNVSPSTSTGSTIP